jgi:hypothetical protein
MVKVIAYIERGKDGSYGVYVDLQEDRLNYGLLGEGKTAEDAIEDFCASYEEMKALHEEEGSSFVEAEFEYRYDMPSFLNYYSSQLTLAGLGRITGVNQHQLSHYATGRKHPRPAMVKKIETALHNFSKELSQVHFYV